MEKSRKNMEEYHTFLNIHFCIVLNFITMLIFTFLKMNKINKDGAKQKKKNVIQTKANEPNFISNK